MTFLTPGSPEHTRTITASKIPAILGISRFTSQFELWHQMRDPGTVPAPTQARQEVFDYGHAVEHAAAAYWRYRNPGWRLSRGETQHTRPDWPFPNAATVDRRASRGSLRRVVEVKSARSLEEWGDDGSGEVPADYAAQVVWQQAVTGWHAPADLVLWPTYGMPRVYQVEWDPQLADHIAARAAAWHRSLLAGTPPDLDDSVSCYEAVRRQHPGVDGTTVEVDPDLAADYLAATATAKAVDAHLRGLKTRLLAAMGTARAATANGVPVAERRPAAKGAVALVAAKTDPHHIQGATAA